MHTKLSWSVALTLCLLGVAGMLGHAAQKMLQVKGSDTMINLGQAWAEAFTRQTRIPVAVTGGGSGTGFAALLNRTCDIAEASRGITPEETAKAQKNNIHPHVMVMAWDGISVIVNPRNPVTRLTEVQLSAIYTGKIMNWKAVGGKDEKIVLLTRDMSSGTYVYFKEHIVQLDNARSPNDYARGAVMQQSNQAIVDEVTGNEKAIGYVGLGYLNPKVRALRREGERRGVCVPLGEDGEE